MTLLAMRVHVSILLILLDKLPHPHPRRMSIRARHAHRELALDSGLEHTETDLALMHDVSWKGGVDWRPFRGGRGLRCSF